MSNKEVLDFNRPEETKDFPVRTEGTSALKLDVADEVLREEKGRDAQIGEIREFVKPERPQAVLPLTNTDAGVQRAPRGMVGPVGNQGREAGGGDRTGGRRKKGLGVRITAGVMAVVAGAGIGYGVFKDKINSFFGGGVDPNDLPPTYPVETPGEMPSQSENIESPTPSAEVTQSPSPEPTETPTPLFSEERTAELNQQITDFINNQGDFTKEKKSEMAIGSETIEKLGDTTELGLADSQPKIEGYLFDYVKKNNSLLLIMGFDGKDGKGFVTPIQIPLYIIEGSASKFYFLKYDFNTVLSSSNVVDTITNENIQKIFERLDKLKEGVIVIQPAFKKYSGSSEDFTGILADYFNEHNSKTKLSTELIISVVTNGIKFESEDYSEGNYEIIKLENVNDVENIDLSKVPMIEPAIIFFE